MNMLVIVDGGDQETDRFLDLFLATCRHEWQVQRVKYENLKFTPNKDLVLFLEHRSAEDIATNDDSGKVGWALDDVVGQRGVAYILLTPEPEDGHVKGYLTSVQNYLGDHCSKRYWHYVQPPGFDDAVRLIATELEKHFLQS